MAVPRDVRGGLPIVRYVELLEVSREWLLPRRHKLLSFSQNIVHEVYHVACCHSDAVAHEFVSIVPFRFDSFHQSLCFLSQGFREAVRDIGFYTTYVSVSAASPAARSLCIAPSLNMVTHVGCCVRLSFMSL